MTDAQNSPTERNGDGPGSYLGQRWAERGQENEEKWGIQHPEELLSAINEEVGEIEQAYLKATHEDGEKTAVKGLRGDYPKEHVAKNALPMAYVDHIGRAWFKAIGEAQGVADYSDYDAEMDARRAAEDNQTLEGFGK